MIHAREAYGQLDAILTLINGRRNLGTSAIKYLIKYKFSTAKLKKYGINVLIVKSNPYGLCILYRDGYENNAKELYNIAEKHEGYLAYWASDDVTRRIGELLEYYPEDIDEFIKRRNENN